MRKFIMVLLMLPLPAAAFTARNGMEARQVSASEIEVLFRNGKSDTDYWCAAGDYVQRVMNLPVSTRLWRASPKPRKAGEGILFTLHESLKSPGAELSQFGAGPRDGALSVGGAVAGHCRVVIPLFPD
ncbi:MAG: hypothetical protein FJX25_17915 [Alphaproteobacteria bacterium]|nr:hypothetical protein [Alphaproteobacteria bacterium]